MKRALLFCLLSGLALACAKSGDATDRATGDVDLVLVGGSVVTNDPAHPRAQAVAVAAGRIAAVGSDAEVLELAGGDTQVVDVHGAWIFPGLVDAHGHVDGLGRQLRELQLHDAKSYDDVLAAVQAQAAKQPEGWIRGSGWDQSLWGKDAPLPDGRALAKIAPDRLVALTRVAGHSVLASPAAVRLAGITRNTKDPEGGKIMRDKLGEPTGLFLDNAMGLIMRHIPAPTAEQQKETLHLALQRAAEFGLTGVGDLYAPTAEIPLYQALADADQLPVRVYMVLNVTDPGIPDLYERGPILGDFFTVRAVKLLADGAMGSRGAALLEDYADDPGNKGIVVTDAKTLEQQADAAVAAGFQPCVHAIGDAANRTTLDVFEKVAKNHPEKDIRFRNEHAQIVALDDLKRFKPLKVIASMQPTHCTTDMRWVEQRIGLERAKGAYAWRTLLDDGVVLAFGSDFPVESPDPLAGIFAAMTRTTQKGEPAGGWFPKQRIKFSEALAAFTSGSAYAEFAEDRRGRIRGGMDADFTVVDGDLAALVADDPGAQPQALLDAKIHMTVVAGRIVYDASK